MGARYWCRQVRASKALAPLVLHFTRHPGDSVIRVAVRNAPAHDIILLPGNPTPADMYRAVRDYTKSLTKHEILTQLGVGTPTPQP